MRESLPVVIKLLCERRLKINEFEIGLGMMITVNEKAVLSVSGLGSCIGLALHDAKNRVGGLAHTVLPDSRNADDRYLTPGKYVDTAVPMLAKKMLSMGSRMPHIRAKLVGGAEVIVRGSSVGSKNAERARAELKRIQIEIVGEDVSSNLGRSMRFDTETGRITIRRYRSRKDGIAEYTGTAII
jgi:chemotaxis protein CheD